MSDRQPQTTNQARIRSKPDIEQAAIELWMQTKNDSADWRWDAVLPTRKEAYRRMAVAVLSAAGCMNGLEAAGRPQASVGRAPVNITSDLVHR